MLEPSGIEAVFELNNISSIDSGNYSCVYMEQEPPFSRSAPSELLELQVNGPPHRPKLEALWKGTIPLGHEARFRCHTQVCKVNAELSQWSPRLKPEALIPEADVRALSSKLPCLPDFNSSSPLLMVQVIDSLSEEKRFIMGEGQTQKNTVCSSRHRANINLLMAYQPGP
ncbi:hypothetical protein STEG23_024896 [Scotinomys teguina]